jgi:hypothetical protein
MQLQHQLSRPLRDSREYCHLTLSTIREKTPESCWAIFRLPFGNEAKIAALSEKLRIRFTNQGNHNIGFDRADNLGVASSTLSHIGSVSFLSSIVESTGAVHPGAAWWCVWGSGSFNQGRVVGRG